MSKEKPELKNGDQIYRVNSPDFGLSIDECDLYGSNQKDVDYDGDDDNGGIPF